ncbi:MAG: hypothetical protein K8I04_06640 [Gammaproteobacteria bacterium]|nr:hypothetical protein [Gammaproteobacteria bacterium]
MADNETFYREDPIEVQHRRLPAEIYNCAHHLLARSDFGYVFVPIRSLQYLAVIDTEEIIFVDCAAKRLVELAWRAFQPQVRTALAQPVPYELHIYLMKAFDVLPRLQGDFLKAIEQMVQRDTAGWSESEAGCILPFPPDRRHNK